MRKNFYAVYSIYRKGGRNQTPRQYVIQHNQQAAQAPPTMGVGAQYDLGGTKVLLEK